MIACAGAFTGLSASSLWIDELFTVYLIHHHGGLGEVFRRALTDTHPPLYYFLLYAWTQLAGLSETALRLRIVTSGPEYEPRLELRWIAFRPGKRSPYMEGKRPRPEYPNGRRLPLS